MFRGLVTEGTLLQERAVPGTVQIKFSALIRIYAAVGPPLQASPDRPAGVTVGGRHLNHSGHVGRRRIRLRAARRRPAPAGWRLAPYPTPRNDYIRSIYASCTGYCLQLCLREQRVLLMC